MSEPADIEYRGHFIAVQIASSGDRRRSGTLASARPRAFAMRARSCGARHRRRASRVLPQIVRLHPPALVALKMNGQCSTRARHAVLDVLIVDFPPADHTGLKGPVSRPHWICF
jgi:hypothetical protein